MFHLTASDELWEICGQGHMTTVFMISPLITCHSWDAKQHGTHTLLTIANADKQTNKQTNKQFYLHAFICIHSAAL